MYLVLTDLRNKYRPLPIVLPVQTELDSLLKATKPENGEVDFQPDLLSGAHAFPPVVLLQVRYSTLEW